MKTLSLLALLVLCASAAVAAVPHAPADTGNQVTTPANDSPSCPDASALPSVEVLPDATPQAINQCRIDCREDYGACLISTPQYICDAVYRNCLANC